MEVRESLGRDVLRLIVWYPLRWAVMVMPIRCGFTIFRLMGDVHYLMSRGGKRALTDKIGPAAAREYYRNHYVNQLQIFVFHRLDKDNQGKLHTFEGLDNLDNALKEGKGCILVHPHFGPPQLPLHLLGVNGYRMMQVGYLTGEGRSFIGRMVAFRLRVKLESRIKARIVQADSFLRPVFDWLKEGGVLMMTGDGAGGRKFIGRYMPFPFWNDKYLFPIGAAKLAAKTGAPLLPTFTTLEQGRYKTSIGPPLHVKNTEEDINRATAHFVASFERYLKTRPGLWHFWDEMDYRRYRG